MYRLVFHTYVLSFIYVWIVLNMGNCAHERTKKSCILYYDALHRMILRYTWENWSLAPFLYYIMCAFRCRRLLEPGLKIAITLRYLATGDFFQSMEFNWRTAHNTVGKFILEVCDAIVEEYAPKVFGTPTTTDGWQEIAKGFQDKWNFPHACGAIDGKHVLGQTQWRWKFVPMY